MWHLCDPEEKGCAESSEAVKGDGNPSKGSLYSVTGISVNYQFGKIQ